jgi:hypothetical protein
MSIQHWYGKISINRIAFKDPTGQDEIGCAAGQTDFMSKMGITIAFDNNVGMRLKDRYHVVLGVNCFTAYNPALSLVYRFISSRLFDRAELSRVLSPFCNAFVLFWEAK